MQHQTNGIETYCEVSGDGPWLVMSHSLAADLRMWDDQMASAKSYRIARYDIRGHGRTSVAKAPYSLELLADDLAALLDRLGIQECHYLGLSLGGMIGQTFALKNPGRFKTMMLADTTSGYPEAAQSMWEARIQLAREKGMAGVVDGTLERWFTEPFRQNRPDAIGRIRQMILATPVEGFVGCCEAIRRINVTARLAEIAAPTLVLVGEQDMATPVAMSETIVRAKPGAELQVLPSASHLSNVEQPQAFNAAVQAFLQKHAS